MLTVDTSVIKIEDNLSLLSEGKGDTYHNGHSVYV